MSGSGRVSEPSFPRRECSWSCAAGAFPPLRPPRNRARDARSQRAAEAGEAACGLDGPPRCAPPGLALERRPRAPSAPSSPRAQRLTLAAAGGSARAQEGERGPSPPAQPQGARGPEGGGADVPGPTEASRRHPRDARLRARRAAGLLPAAQACGGHEGRKRRRSGPDPQPGRSAFSAVWAPLSHSRARPADRSRVTRRSRALASVSGSPGG